MAANTKISNLISSQVPFFVRNDHDNFVRFVEAYYEFLEQSNTVTGIGNTIDMAKSMPDNLDIDRTIDLFAEKFYEHYLKLLPKNIIADKSLIVKHIKDFYTARGTEKSIEFLLRVMFGEENTEFYYPKRDVLRASDGKWFIEKSLKIKDVHINGTANDAIAAVEHFNKRQIKGNTSSATAVVERVDIYYESGVLVKELKIAQQTKNFSDGETLFTTFTEEGNEYSLTANLFSGQLNTVTVDAPGSGYFIGDQVSVEGGNGSGAIVVVSSVTSGNISGMSVVYGGAGFQVNNSVLITGGGGSGAKANVLTVDLSGSYHPNSYNVMYTTIADLANVTINSANYSIYSTFVNAGANANTTIANAAMFFAYSNTGPVSAVLVTDPGTNYTFTPNTSIIANTRVVSLGILGRMSIIDGGVGYQVGDPIYFDNPLGSYGLGAKANVKSVNGSGAITAVQFTTSPVPGYPVGGMGYLQSNLPTANVVSANVSAHGANIAVTSILGAGEILGVGTSSIGSINQLAIVNKGAGYTNAPTLNLKAIGDGTAQASATIITGTYSYPGRYINDDGHLSSYNFIQDRDYYQDYSYVVKVKQSIEKYKKALKDLIHPAGMKLFGEYLYVDNGATLNVSISNGYEQYNTNITYAGSYHANGNTLTTTVNVTIQNTSTLNVATLANVYIEFLSGDTANLSNSVFPATYVSANTFRVKLTRANIASITIANTGTGYSNGYLYFAGGHGSGANASYTVNTQNGGIETITIHNRGSLYITGDKVIAIGNGGSGANLVIALQATTANAVSNVRGNLLFSRI